MQAFPFLDENRKRDAYWRDVGTIDTYYQANIELTAVEPQLNLYDDHWPVRTYQPNLPPSKFVFKSDDRCGAAFDSIVCAGAIISGGQVTRTIVGPQTRINSYAEVEDSIIFSRVNIGRQREDSPGDHRQGRVDSRGRPDRLRSGRRRRARVRRFAGRRGRHRQGGERRAGDGRERLTRACRELQGFPPDESDGSSCRLSCLEPDADDRVRAVMVIVP